MQTTYFFTDYELVASIQTSTDILDKQANILRHSRRFFCPKCDKIWAAISPEKSLAEPKVHTHYCPRHGAKNFYLFPDAQLEPILDLLPKKILLQELLIRMKNE